MRILFAVALFFGLAGTALADIPSFSAVCPGPIPVGAEAGGPVTIDDAPAQILSESKYAFKARGGEITVAVAIRPDASLSVSFVGPGDTRGVCLIQQSEPVDHEQQL